MKPDWKDSPSWAKYAAMDKCGAWYWYEEEPEYIDGQWWPSSGAVEEVNIPRPRKSLEQRPQ